MDSADFTTLRRDVRAVVKEWRADGRFQPRPDAWLRNHDREFTRLLAEHGWIGMAWPKNLGGGGRSLLARLAVTEELLRAGAPVAAHWIADRQIGPAILDYGTSKLQEEFLPRIAAGEITFCLGMSEPEAGSDLAAVTTRATRNPEGWTIRGTKVWTSHAHECEYAYVLARTDDRGDKHEGLTEFIVDMHAPGVSVSPIRDLHDEHHFNEVTFDDVEVPHRWVLGVVGNGWTQVTNQLALERGGPERILSTYLLLEAAIDTLADSQDGAALEVLGSLAARATALRTRVWHVAAAVDRGEAPTEAAAEMKYLGTEFERVLADSARHLLDANVEPPSATLGGLMGDAMLATPGFGIRGGASAVLLQILGRGEVRR